MAFPSKSRTVFTTFGSMMSPGVLIDVATVQIEACGSSSRALTATSIASGSSSGSSPCTFTKTSPSSCAATSATRSVPVRCSARVIRASPPNPSTAFMMRTSSVATIKRADRVIVATDDVRIIKAVEGFGGEARMTRAEHRTGTERVAEVAAHEEGDVFVNVQGDEPLLDPDAIDVAVNSLLEEPQASISTVAPPIKPPGDIMDPNGGKK